MRLSGQTALITGGSSGVGLALARALHARGNRVFICGRDQERLTRSAKELPGLETICCDLAQETGVQTLVEAIQARAPELNILINNAAVQLTYTFPDIPSKDADSKIRLELSTNLVAPLLLSAYLLPLLAKQPEAALVNLTSGLALAPKKSAAVYCASKAGLRTFTKALRYQVEDAGWNVRVVEAMLPLVDTPMTAGRGSSQFKLSPERVAGEVLQDLARNRMDIKVGGVKAFAGLYRLLPGMAERVFRNS